MSSITIKLFASLKETLGKEEVQLDIADSLSIVNVIQMLATKFGSDWQSALMADDIKVAVNQTLVEKSHIVSAGDEVAFLPPVTGG